MSELDPLLGGFKETADATVFADVQVTEALRDRIRRAAAAEGLLLAARDERDVGGVVEPIPGPPPARRRRSHRGLMAAAAIALPSRTTTVAALSVSFADRMGVITFEVDDLVPASADADAGTGSAAVRGTNVDVMIDAPYWLWHRWSPDGTRLLFGHDLDLYVYDTRTGSSFDLTNTPDRVELMPTWSPDGNRISFTSRPIDAGETAESLIGVFGGAPSIVDSDGSDYTVLAEGRSTSPPTWGPDGTRVAYVIADRLYVHTLGDAAGRSIDLVGLDAVVVGAPSWSPRADTVAIYVSNSGHEPSWDDLVAGTAPLVDQSFVLVDLATGDTRPAYSYRAPFVPRQPARWSSDGQRLAIVFRQETAIDDPTGVVVVGLDGSSTELTSSGLVAQVAWHPTENTLAVLDETDPTTVTLFDVGPDGAATRHSAHFDVPVTGIGWAPKP